jgi:hypothetical protein
MEDKGSSWISPVFASFKTGAARAFPRIAFETMHGSFTQELYGHWSSVWVFACT